MKKLSIYTTALLAAVFLVSCKPHSMLQKDIKYMQVRLKPLSRNDLTLVGNLETQITISGKIKGSGATQKKFLDKSFASNYKKGLISKSEATEMLYFAPNQNEVITGSLYDNEIFNSVYGSGNLNKRGGLFGGLMAKLSRARQLAAAADPGLDFGYFALVEKYPDIDYFINVRFDRKTIVSTGGKFTETVIVKADGVKLKTD